MKEFDQYRYLNKDRESKVIVELDYDEVAQIIVEQNKGLHRMVCALVRASEKYHAGWHWPRSELSVALREAATKYRG